MSREIQRSIDNKFEYGTVVGLYISVSQIISIQTDYFAKLMKVSSKI